MIQDRRDLIKIVFIFGCLELACGFLLFWCFFSPFLFPPHPEHISVSGESFPILFLFPEHFFLKSSRVERGEFLQRMPGEFAKQKYTRGYYV